MSVDLAGSREQTLDQRIERIDTLMCLLFAGLVKHPLATSLVPPQELEALRKLLPQEE